MSASYTCLVCMICIPYMYTLYVCFICMPYMHALYVWLYALYVYFICFTCMPYTYDCVPYMYDTLLACLTYTYGIHERYTCHTCMPYVYFTCMSYYLHTSYACLTGISSPWSTLSKAMSAPHLICILYMYTLYVCLICMPYMYALQASARRGRH